MIAVIEMGASSWLVVGLVRGRRAPDVEEAEDRRAFPAGAAREPEHQTEETFGRGDARAVTAQITDNDVAILFSLVELVEQVCVRD